MTTLTNEELAARLARLEVTCEGLRLRARSWRSLVVATAFGVVALASLGARQAQKARIIEAERFVLRSADGTPRASLSVGPNGGPILALTNPNGTPAMTLSVSGTGDNSLMIFDGVGKPRVTLASAGGKAVITALGKGAGTSIGLAVSEQEVLGKRGEFASLVAIGSGGKGQAALSSRSDGGAALTFTDREGIPRAYIEVDKEGKATLQLQDGEMKPTFHAPAAPER